ncbi:hypothetical protein [Acinetobacter pseudolwoffii]|uniref:hypothetical protein n=1 Tax=Acinetobacter pseudolwoffii TaxID=2053287 RepID=UPI000C235C86|nr:hypothetical protein [Acinetobacter pseudolwoffii]PJI29422.1 hypothetical protein CU478_09620 [Acinetobacter pseudolwoffii]
MFRNGKIKTYDSERGTGSIELADDAQELSFRLQDLPSPEIDPHQETIILDNMVRLDVKVQDEFVAEVVALPYLAPTISVPLKRSILFSPMLWLALVSAVGFIILGEV